MQGGWVDVQQLCPMYVAMLNTPNETQIDLTLTLFCFRFAFV